MFTDPLPKARDIFGFSIDMWRSNPIIHIDSILNLSIPVIAAHNFHITIWPGKLEGIGDLVLMLFKKCDDTEIVMVKVMVIVYLYL